VSSIPNVHGFVLAGGASRRFGRDKALVDFDSEPLIARLCRILQAATQQPVRIIGDPEKYAPIGVDCVADRWPDEGPLGGIVTALSANTAGGDSTDQNSWSLIIGCDMPFLTSEWLRYMAERATSSRVQVVVPKSTYGLEPLCAYWRASATPTLARAFDSGTRRVTDAMKQLPMEVLDAADWKRFDNFDRLFWNMNTPADYEEAIRMMKAERP
jgi:molybdopterin-guanine dinucleotide biosynthesis protein A